MRSQQSGFLALLSLSTVVFVGQALGQTDAVETPAPAAVPHVVQYAGTAGIRPDGGAVRIEFALYAAETGGAPVWKEAQTIVPDAKGRYTVLLGAATGGGLPQAVFSSAEAKWLGVTLAGGEELPRTLLVATPYTLKAADAETLGGHPASDFALASVRPKPDTATDVTQINTSSGILGGGTGPTVSLTADPTYFNTYYGQLAAANAFTASNSFSKPIVSTVATGTAPFTVASTTAVPNLDASLLGGAAAAAYPQLALQNTFTNNEIFGPSSVATSSTGHSSFFLWLNASVYNSSKAAAQSIGFQFRAEPLDNNSSTPNANLALLSTVNSATPQETGFKITANGIVTFVAGQTFPGAGTITGVTAGTGLTGGGTTGAVTLAVNTTYLNTNYAQLNANNSFGANETYSGNNIYYGTNTFGDGIIINSGDLAVSAGNIDLPTTTGSAAGVVTLDTLPFLHGYQAGSSAPTNIFAGPSAGNFSMTSNALFETAVGQSSLSALTSGSGNTAVGSQALTRTTTGQSNLALGYNSGVYNTTGNNNTYIGANAGSDSNSTGLVYSAAIGAGATVSESNAISLGGTAGNTTAVKVGIGTATPAYTLDVQGTGNFTGAVNFAGTTTFSGNETYTGTHTITGNETLTGNQTINGNQIISASDAGTAPIEVTNTSTYYAIEATGYEAIVATATGSGGVALYANSPYTGVQAVSKTTSGAGYGVIASAASANTSGVGLYASGYTGINANGATTPAGSNSEGIGVMATGAFAVVAATNESDNYGFGVAATGGTAYGASSTVLGAYSPATTGVGVSASGGIGVLGNSTDPNDQGVGVAGQSSQTNGIGVEGSGQFGVVGSSASGIAVYGVSTNYIGVAGMASYGGVFVGSCCSQSVSSNTVPYYGAEGRGTAGLVGETLSTEASSPSIGWGVIGSGPNSSASFSTEGASFASGSAAGIWGDITNYGGAGSGILATADSDSALIAANNSTNPAMKVYNYSTTAGKPVFETYSPGVSTADHCTIDTSANLTCSGTVSNVARVKDDKQVAMYAVTSPENWHEDFGSATLAGGTAHVSLEAIFGSSVNTEMEYHVFLTPKGDCEGLFVTNESGEGFDVRELHHGKSSVAFDYRIVAKRKGFEQVRMEDLTARIHETNQREAEREEAAKHPPVGVKMPPEEAAKHSGIKLPNLAAGPMPAPRATPRRSFTPLVEPREPGHTRPAALEQRSAVEPPK